MKIKATVKRIERVRIECPKDSVHVAGKDGKIKGVHSVWFDKKLVPKGMTALYWQLNEKKGIKIFYSLNRLTCGTLKTVKYVFKKQQKIFKMGICPKPYKIKKVNLKLVIDGKKIKETAYGIVMENIPVPPTWEQYAQGKPYKWGNFKHPDHTPEAYLRFVKRIKKRLKSSGIKIYGSFKLGDCMWSTKKKRWYLVDID
jgi:hypothetical protein